MFNVGLLYIYKYNVYIYYIRIYIYVYVYIYICFLLFLCFVFSWFLTTTYVMNYNFQHVRPVWLSAVYNLVWKPFSR